MINGSSVHIEVLGQSSGLLISKQFRYRETHNSLQLILLAVRYLLVNHYKPPADYASIILGIILVVSEWSIA